MAKIIEITDISANGPDVYSHLTEAQLRNKQDPEKGIFIAETAKVVKLALDMGYSPLSMLIEKKQINAQARELIDRCGDIPVYTADDDLLAGLVGFQLNRGILCALRRPKLPAIEEVCKNAHRIAILENIMDSTNIGAVFRSAAALGIDAVLLTPSCCDPFCRRAVRVSMGTILQVPWTRIGDKPSDWLNSGIDRLHALGFKTAAMALDDRSVSIDDPKLKSEEKLAIILGTEGDGLLRSTISACDYSVKIPMYHGVDSLNVAAAGAVAFWELRSRNVSDR